MTMHLVGPWLSTTGKRKGKPKFRNAAEAQKARELKAEWEKKQQEWNTMPKLSKGSRPSVVKSNMPKLGPPPGRETRHIPSVDTGVGNAPAPQAKVYTGSAMLGVAQMAKSNAVPVFNTDHIIEIARMRR